MNLLLSRLAAFILLPAILGHAAAQEAPVKAAVYVQATAEDAVGRTLVYEVREAVRRSSGLALADRELDARFILRIVTIDPDSSRSPGISTVYSAVYTRRTLHETPVDMYLTNTVGTCGSSRVESCARRMTATLDEQAVEFRAMLRNVLDAGNQRK